MFTIRQQHLAAFEQVALEQFEDTVAAHLQENFAEECAALGDSAVHELIAQGVGRAAAYGIEAETDVCLYIDLMVLFGRDFDRDPKLPWASAILRDPKWEDPSARVNHLYDTAVQRLEESEALPEKRQEA